MLPSRDDSDRFDQGNRGRRDCIPHNDSDQKGKERSAASQLLRV